MTKRAAPVSGLRDLFGHAVVGGLLAALAALALRRIFEPVPRAPQTLHERAAPPAVAPRRAVAPQIAAPANPPPRPAVVADSAQMLPRVQSLASDAVGLPAAVNALPVARAEPARPPPVATSKPHRVPFAVLTAWSKPGLCSSSEGAAQVRATMTENFRILEPGDGGKFYLDPRLPPDAEQPILASLRHAEQEAAQRLDLHPARPLVFVYADQALMKAAACINESVVAFYDGALHVVANRPDVDQSFVHEYTHHALFSSGFVTPAWAQEGIAMTVAQERWWKQPRYLQTVLASPFSAAQLDRLIPYKLPSDQAITFYVQSAALVQCIDAARGFGLRDLLAALRAGSSADALSYDLPELEQSGFLLACLQSSAR